MATVRVFVPTCGRPQLLQRALDSLLSQTFQDWIAEVHNDLPEDNEPARIVGQLNDSRIQFVQHSRNLGGTATFNLFFRNTSEPFYSLLEDDNWWEPSFLEKMISHMHRYPNVVVAWSNQRVAQESVDGSWIMTDHTVRPRKQEAQPQLITWPQIDQLYGALHSQGAMIVRARRGDDFRIPEVEMTGIEGFRERVFPHPMLYVPEPLGWFSVTRHTYRNRSNAHFVALQSLMAGSLLIHSPSDKLDPETVWSSARSDSLPRTTLLIVLCLAHRELRHQLQHAALKDWARFFAATVKRPHVSWAALRAHLRRPDLWQFLETNTARRFAEATNV
jgi:glycosyltransferase involved in cell wall biosynthesis